MGMALEMVAVPGTEIGSVLADPDLAIERLFPEDDEPVDGLAPVTLDQAWHGIHYLLTGSASSGAPPLNALLLGNLGNVVDVPEDEWGIGPPWLLHPLDVAEFAAALADLSNDDLRARFAPEEMIASDVYPNIWTNDPDESLAYLLRYVDVLREFFSSAGKNSQGVLLALQ